MLTFLERLSHNVLPKNWKRETLDACIGKSNIVQNLELDVPYKLESFRRGGSYIKKSFENQLCRPGKTSLST